VYGAAVRADALPRLEEVDFVVVDVETTGLDPDADTVLQLGVVVTRTDGIVRDEWVTYLRRRHWRPGRLGAHHVHGITRRHLRGGIRPADALARLNATLDRGLFVAHNARFDLGFLEHEARLADTALRLDATLCTLLLSRALDPRRTMSHRLGDVLARHGVAIDRPHDALADALGAASVLPRLLAANGIATTDDLRARLVAREHAPGGHRADAAVR
jgi:DNA polymerase-3 subunit epsilon